MLQAYMLSCIVDLRYPDHMAYHSDRINSSCRSLVSSDANCTARYLVTRNSSVAVASITFANYIAPGMTQPIIGKPIVLCVSHFTKILIAFIMVDLALLRALMITAGMVVALLMNSLVYPRHCRVRQSLMPTSCPSVPHISFKYRSYFCRIPAKHLVFSVPYTLL